MRPWQVFVGLVLLGLPALGAVRPTGDGAEYLLTAHAFATHGTPDLRAEDVIWLAREEPPLARVVRPLREGMERAELTPLPSVRRAPSGAYYSLHFWFYSLVAAPLLGVIDLLGLRPVRALALTNLLLAAGAVVALWLHYGRSRFALAAGALFVLSGTTFYLAWTGPEVLTGAAMLGALLLARRGEPARGALAGAVAALQNPSAVFVVPFVLLAAGRRWRSLGRSDHALAVLALGTAVLPYAFFFAAFHVPSLIARFATDFSLIGSERAFSLVFDLNEGMIMGLPGLVIVTPIALGLALAAASAPARRQLGLGAAATVALVAAMAAPTFAIHNWNSGNSVFIRYAYWLAVPVLLLQLELTRALAERPRWVLLGAAAALQLAAVAANGVWGERYSYVRHTWLAKLVLRHAPAAYNPVPEIFYERSLGWEAPAGHRVVVWPYKGTPGKVMARVGLPARSKRVCPDGGEVLGATERPGSDGWRYLDPPFRCRGGSAP